MMKVMEMSTRTYVSDRTRVLSEQADRFAVTLESILAALRSKKLEDKEARSAAIEVAASALVHFRGEETTARELIEPVDRAFSRLRDDLKPLSRFGKVNIEFVDPPENGRALPGDVARAARAMVRNTVLTLINSADASRMRLHWDCDGRNLLMHIRDDGSGVIRPYGDELRTVVEQLTALDGDMSVTSTPGWGTEISLTIPLDPTRNPPLERLADLSSREREILEHLAVGETNSEIANDLHLSSHTVKFHVSKILKKTKARNRAEIIAMMA